MAEASDLSSDAQRVRPEGPRFKKRCVLSLTLLMARADLQKKSEARRATLTETAEFGDEPPHRGRLSQDHAVYAAMVEALDQAVGSILAKLDELHLAENTLVIFNSDNGGLSTSEGSPTSNHPLRAGQGWLYEGGIRTAALLRCPGVIPVGVTNDTPVISADYLPTILAGTGIAAAPSQYGPSRDHQLSSSESPRVSRMTATLVACQKEVGATLSIPNPVFDPVRPSGRN